MAEQNTQIPRTTLKKKEGWIGIDLDGTLARDDNRPWPEVGEPVPAMMERLKRYLADGYEVRIVTARAAKPELIPAVEEWLEKQGIGGLQVTNEKDMDMIMLFDDRVVQVIPNTGVIVGTRQFAEESMKSMKDSFDIFHLDNPEE